MKDKKVFIIIFMFLAVSVCGYIYLSGNRNTAEDENIFKWINSETELVYYKRNPDILPASEETERAHDNFIRVKLNKKALSVLDSNGQLPAGSEFPDSSIIIKEIFSDKGSDPVLLAVMIKLKNAENSAKNWLWAEYSPTGEAEYSVTKKGKVCTGCHKPGDDYVRIFDIVK